MEKTITAEFSDTYNGFTTPGGGHFELYKQAGPYEYLLGALSGCLYATFKGIAEKMHITWTGANFKVSCTKRAEPPTTMDHCCIEIEASGVSDQKKFESAMEKATRYCSIFQTLSHVSEMKWSVTFN